MRPWLAERASLAPRALALVDEGRRLDFAALAARSDLLARRLASRGVGPGRRIASFLEPSERAIELVHAVQRLGATLVPLHPRLAPPEAARLLAVVDPALVVRDAGELDEGDPASGPVLCDVVRADAPQAVVFTSGTSGRAKGVVLGHAQQAASAAAACARLAVTADDRWLLCMPLCHVGGLGIVVRSAQAGFGVVVQRRFDPEAVVRAVADERVTVVSVVATMLSRIVEAAGDRPGALASLRCVLVGGGPLPAPVLARARAAGLPVAQTYGLTEAASMVTCEEPGAGGEAGAAGAPVAGVQVRIAGADPDGIGEIRVRGRVVMDGYLGDAPATAAAMPDGWLRTGDLGRLTDDGVLHVAGRRSDVIVTGGENVHPSEVEAVLLAHPAVAEAAVYGVADDVWGERIEAKVVFRGPPVNGAVLAAWCGTQLARFKIPKAFHPVGALARTPSGKVVRAAH